MTIVIDDDSNRPHGRKQPGKPFMKKKKTARLSAAQFEIMDLVWNLGEASINQVMNAINQSRKKKLTRSTIQVQMARLEEKGWLSHRKDGRTFLYKALKKRNEAQAFIARDVADRVFNGSSAALVKCLFDMSKISNKELKELRKILDESERK
jgi:predicted transcriptional regulator